MTRTRPTDRSAALLDANGWRDDLIAKLEPIEDLAGRPWSELRGVEIFPGVPLGGEIVVPEGYMPTSAVRRRSHRTLDLTLDGRIGPTDAARDEALRRAILALWLTRPADGRPRIYKPSSWVVAARRVFRMATWILDHKPGPQGVLFAHLEHSDVLRMLGKVSSHPAVQARFKVAIRDLQAARERGILIDSLSINPATDEASSEASTLEPRRKDKIAVERKPREETRNWQPLPDAFVTELLRRAIWLNENIGEQLVACWSELRRIGREFETRGLKPGDPRVMAARQRALTNFSWRDANGVPIAELPFEITFGTQTSHAWPPPSTRYVNTAIATLQALNLCVVAFCAGARASELGSATDESLRLADGGAARLSGKSFKLAQEIGGEDRDWPLHARAVQALLVQMTLAKEVRPESEAYLWVLTGETGEPIGSRSFNLTSSVVEAAKILGLRHLAGEERPHLHRWRHTVGRLVALTITSAPQVLMDLFGHRDLEMTMTYMLADPEIARDALKVAEEFSIAMAEEAITETLEGRTSGPAARPLRDGLFSLGLYPSKSDKAPSTAMRDGEKQYGATTLREAAEILTLNRRYWALVRPGVICTKTLGQVGPCTQGRGEPDPGSCRTDCTHRLETALAKRQCREALGALIVEYEAAVRDGFEMLVENLEGQIKANLKRWDDVREELIATNAAIARIWAKEAG